MTTRKNVVAAIRPCSWMRRRFRKPKCTPRDPTVRAQMRYSNGNGRHPLLDKRWIGLHRNTNSGAKPSLFEALKSRLTAGEVATIPYEELANRLGRTATHLRVEVTRLRARYRAILREEVSGTVVDSGDVDEELRYLRQAMIA